MALAQNIKRIRESRDLDQKELAKLVQISAPSICHYEKGDKSPSLAVAVRIANALRCSMDDLCDTKYSRNRS